MKCVSINLKKDEILIKIDDKATLENTLDELSVKLVDLKNKVSKPHIKQECNDMILKISKILKYLEKHPNKIGENKKFFTYYLETIYKIVNSYYEISSQDVHTKEIEEVIKKTENSLTIINKSLDDQFTKMLQNDALDLDTEVDFLKSSMQMKDF